MSDRSRGRPTKSRCSLCTGKNRRCDACRFGIRSNSSSSSSSSSTSSSFDPTTGWRFSPPPSSARTEPSRILPAVGKGAYPKQVAKAQAKEDKEKEKSTGRILFNRRQDNIHGIVVDVVRIKQRFSGIKKDQDTTPIHPREAYWRVHSLSKLKEHVGPMEDLPTGKGAKFKLARIMAERDKRNNYPEGFKEGGYVETSFLNENNYGEFMYY